jgi:hypothetical protein
MPSLDGRRSERIAYRAPVELLAWNDGDLAPRRVIARTLDLGEGGMRLRAPVQMPVGAQVTCCVELDGQAAELPGRVAWMHRGGSVRHGEGHGMGICFEALATEQTTLLHQVVGRASERCRRIELRLPGLPAPVQARAYEREGGLRLSAKLPILARGAELAFRVEQDGPWLRGRIGAAALLEQQGERSLEIDVDVVESEQSRPRKHARYLLEDEAREPSASETSQPAHAGTGLRQWMLLGAVCVALALVVTWPSLRSRPPVARAHEAAPFVARPAAEARAQLPAPQADVSADQSEGDRALPTGAALPIAESSVSQMPVVRETASPAPPPPQQETGEPPGPALRVDGDAVSVKLPFDGNLDGMRVRVWADPHALAVDLPHGKTSLQLGHYPMRDGDVTDVQVNSRDETLLVRVKVQAPIDSYAVTAGDGTLDIDFVRERTAARETAAQ